MREKKAKGTASEFFKQRTEILSRWRSSYLIPLGRRGSWAIDSIIKSK